MHSAGHAGSLASFALTVRFKESEITGIALLVIKVRTINMKYHEEFPITVLLG